MFGAVQKYKYCANQQCSRHRKHSSKLQQAWLPPRPPPPYSACASTQTLSARDLTWRDEVPLHRAPFDAGAAEDRALAGCVRLLVLQFDSLRFSSLKLFKPARSAGSLPCWLKQAIPLGPRLGRLPLEKLNLIQWVRKHLLLNVVHPGNNPALRSAGGLGTPSS